MLRAILGVILGYVAMVFVVFIALTVAFFALGVERAYQPGSYEVSGLWIGIMIAVGVVAALVGGAVCRAIAQRPKPVIALAIVVAIIGTLQLLLMFFAERPDPGARGDDVELLDAMMQSIQPIWTAALNIVIGVVGVLIGGRAFSGAVKPAD